MKIVWRDSVLQSYTIDLTDAVDVKVNGIEIRQAYNDSIVVQTQSILNITPMSSNVVKIQNGDK